MTSHLLIFTIAEGGMDDFVAARLKGVYPLRLHFGFTINTVWVLQGSNKLAWVLSYNGADHFELRDAAYYASSDRHEVDLDPRQYITSVEAYFLANVVSRS